MIFRSPREFERKYGEEVCKKRITRIQQVREQSIFASKKNAKLYQKFQKITRLETLIRYRQKFEINKIRKIDTLIQEFEERNDPSNKYSESHVEAQRKFHQILKKSQDDFWVYMECEERKIKRGKNSVEYLRYLEMKKNFKIRMKDFYRSKVKFDEEKRRIKLHQSKRELPNHLRNVDYKLISRFMKEEGRKKKYPLKEVRMYNREEAMEEILDKDDDRKDFRKTYVHLEESRVRNNKNLIFDKKLERKGDVNVIEKLQFGGVIAKRDEKVINQRGLRKGRKIMVKRASRKDRENTNQRNLQHRIERKKFSDLEKDRKRRIRFKRAIERGMVAHDQIWKKKKERKVNQMFENLKNNEIQQRLEDIPKKYYVTISDIKMDNLESKRLERLYERRFKKRKRCT